jgi:hypothetical protein
MSIPRNAPCPCGSKKKYKNCHGIEAAAQFNEQGRMTPIAQAEGKKQAAYYRKVYKRRFGMEAPNV